MHLNVDCDIDILESGVDQKITSEDPHGNRGWVGHMDAKAYVDQHRRYIAKARTDSRFRCETPFTLDGDKIWESFWIEYCMPEMVALSNEVRNTQPPQPEPTPPDTIRVGIVTAPLGLKYRSGPGTNYPALGALAYESTVLYDNQQNGFLHVIEGWVSADYVGEPVPIVEEGPMPVEPTPTGDKWERSRAFVRKWEGGYSDNPEDHGNWTGGQKGVGELKGTKYGISAASYPQLDIRNLTMAEADAIYFRDYWQASDAASLSWPYCLLAFDTAVLHGVGTSRKWQQEVGDNPLAFAAKRLRVYTKLDNWDVFGAGWVNRAAELLEEASKP